MLIFYSCAFWDKSSCSHCHFVDYFVIPARCLDVEPNTSFVLVETTLFHVKLFPSFFNLSHDHPNVVLILVNNTNLIVRYRRLGTSPTTYNKL